jgi:hypothetical protein
MISEDQVCSFAQGMRLDDLGLQTNSLFGWHQEASDLKETLVLYIGDRRDASKYGWHYVFPAYTVAELGVLLPWAIGEGISQEWVLHTHKDDDGEYCVTLLDLSDDYRWFCKKEFYADNEAQVRAEALIWLIEEKYIAAGELKL